jgi:hypothetical protein
MSGRIKNTLNIPPKMASVTGVVAPQAARERHALACVAVPYTRMPAPGHMAATPTPGA